MLCERDLLKVNVPFRVCFTSTIAPKIGRQANMQLETSAREISALRSLAEMRLANEDRLAAELAASEARAAALQDRVSFLEG